MKKSVDEIAAYFGELKRPLRYPDGAPNLEPRDAVRITDTAPILKLGPEGYELVNRRWSWPGPTGKPIYNYRSEGRTLSGRCLILTDGFYEFTEPQPGDKKKTRWIFTMPGFDWFGIAGIVRPWQDGEAFTMLTMEPGPDVAPYHSRQVAALSPGDGLDWLDPRTPEAAVLKPYAAGALAVERA